MADRHPKSVRTSANATLPRTRPQRRKQNFVISGDAPRYDGIFAWERDLWLPHAPDLIRALLGEEEDDEDDG